MRSHSRLAALCVIASLASFGGEGCDGRPVVEIFPRGGDLRSPKIRMQQVDKLDLLFVVDNSMGMADKQAELGRRVPELIAALTDDTPDPDTGKPNHAVDMHVAVITSSLGSQGTSACDPRVNAHHDDKGHLLPRAGEVTCRASGFVASICNETYSPALAGLAKKLKAALHDSCIKSEVVLRPDGSAICQFFESMPGDTFVGTRCEDIAKGLCTPGAAPCRKEGSDFPPIDLAAAAATITLPITVLDRSGLGTSENVTGRVDGPNVVLVGSDRKKHVVCEVLQLEGDAAPRCLHDPKFGLDAATDSGWCYSQDPAVLGPRCTLGTIRLGGGAEPRKGSEEFVLCGKG